MKKIILILIMLLLCSGVALAESTEDFTAEIIKKAKAGDAESQRLLGYMYWLGTEDVDQDDDDAFDWLEQAAEQGDVIAQKAVADFYLLGTGVYRDLEQSFIWMQRAAEQGDAEAQTRLAEYYYAGRGVTQDIPKTVEWLRKAMAQDYEPARTALFNLKTAVAGRGYDHLFGGVADPIPSAESAALYDEAVAYFSGRGVEKNPYRAFELASQSAAQGYVDAYVLVGQMYLDGQGPTRNYKRALEWFTKAANRNHVQAQYYLSVMYYDGKGAAVDFVEAYKWALIAWENAPGSDVVLQQMQIIRNRMSKSAASKAQFLADQWAKERM